MSKTFQKLLKALKTSDEVKALGFNKEELRSLASDMDKNLTLEENASDEEIESAVEEAVEAAIPFLKLAQKSSSRIVKKSLDKKKKDEEIEDEEDEDDEEQDDDEPVVKKKTKKEHRKESNDDSEIKKMFDLLMKKIDKQDETISSLRKANVKDKRRIELEKLLKDTGSFGKRTIRQFEKMTFENDDDFDEFLDEVMEDLKDANQERANAGLAKLGVVTPDKKTKEEQVELMTEEELDKLADVIG